VQIELESLTPVANESTTKEHVRHEPEYQGGNQFCVRGMFDSFADGEFGYNKEIDVSED
jgi:hypothetical protein